RNAECGMRNRGARFDPESVPRVRDGARYIPHSAFRTPHSGWGRAGMKGGRWLAIDTATEIASVAVGSPTGAAAGAFVQGARRHAAAIVQLVDHVLTQAGLRPADLEGIVIGDGPGSFTGLRIGWAAAKGLAQQAAVPRQYRWRA